MVSYPGGTGAASGYLAEPAGDAPAPGIVVIQEWWGVDEHIRELTRRFAREGFLALAPDLYHGRVTDKPEEAMALSRGTAVEDGTADVLAAIAYLKSLPRVQPKKVGVIGFCMGGGYALEAAIRSPDVGAAAPFYGGRTGQLIDRVDRIQAPLLAVFGAEDPSIPLEVVERFRQALAAAGKQADVRVYPGAGHAFLNDTRPSYRAEQAADAWARAVAFFKEHLK
jgi:carboxymethylenebutenolidase